MRNIGKEKEKKDKLSGGLKTAFFIRLTMRKILIVL